MDRRKSIAMLIAGLLCIASPLSIAQGRDRPPSGDDRGQDRGHQNQGRPDRGNPDRGHPDRGEPRRPPPREHRPPPPPDRRGPPDVRLDPEPRHYRPHRPPEVRQPRHDNRRDWDQPRYYHRPPPPPRWGRGERLPDYYWDDRYVVYDWERRNLRPPPRDYRWVRTDEGDYLLVGIATGIIIHMILSQ